ncbi:MAG: alanine racemase [Alphaproteobacteria bacterium]|nr:alanine racemase [Alphaproteobacteria bacterium]
MENILVKRPTLFLDEVKCRQNIARMREKALRSGVAFRPHFKTHQSSEIGRWFRERGVDRITVSSVTMAEYFAADGWKDITIAFPVNLPEIDAIDRLASQVRLNLLVESPEVIRSLDRGLRHSAGVFIKIDTGYGRTGVQFDQFTRIGSLLEAVSHSRNLEAMGFLTHSGHTYQAGSADEIRRIHRESVERLTQIKRRFQDKYPSLIISTGDTPSCSVVEDFGEVDEIRPGNFVFYDGMQTALGSCTDDRIAVAMACPVVAVHPERQELVIYGGAVHFSKERLHDSCSGVVYGWGVARKSGGWGDRIDGMYLAGLSQEHGIVSLPPGLVDQYSVGDTVLIIPVHSCLTASCMKEYTTLSGRTLSTLR